jgi:hypothetical protein
VEHESAVRRSATISFYAARAKYTGRIEGVIECGKTGRTVGGVEVRYDNPPSRLSDRRSLLLLGSQFLLFAQI